MELVIKEVTNSYQTKIRIPTVKGFLKALAGEKTIDEKKDFNLFNFTWKSLQANAYIFKKNGILGIKRNKGVISAETNNDNMKIENVGEELFTDNYMIFISYN